MFNFKKSLYLLCEVPINEETVIIPVMASSPLDAMLRIEKSSGLKFMPYYFQGKAVHGFSTTDHRRFFVWNQDLKQFLEHENEKRN